MLKKRVFFNMSRVNRVPISRSASGWVTATLSRVFTASVGLLRPDFSRIEINYYDPSPRCSGCLSAYAVDHDKMLQ